MNEQNSKCCSRCHERKPLASFPANKMGAMGRYSQCNACKLTSARERYRIPTNRDRVLKKSKARDDSMTLEERREYRRMVRFSNPDGIKKSRLKYITKDPKRWRDYFRNYEKEQRKTNPVFRIRNSLKCRMRKVLKGTAKSKSTMDLVGCSGDFLKSHIEKQFTPGMSWTNYGEWHIDHRKPCASFDLSDPEQQKECFHWSNLQPLWAIDNMRKGSKYEEAA